MQTIQLTFHTDPGHGWLEVPEAHLAELGMRPTRYSYRANGVAYLEEDCDANTYLELQRARGVTVTFREVHTNRDSFIRRLQRFP